MEQHNTLHYDETSKEGFKYGSIQVTTEQDQSYEQHNTLQQIRVYPGDQSKINHTCWDYLTWTVDQHNTLHYDETSKEGFKYGSIQVTTEQDQSYVLGLFDMDGGAA